MNEYQKHVKTMSDKQRADLIRAMTPRMVDQYLPHTPHTTQQMFLLLNNEEALFGGAAGGGKFQSVSCVSSIVYDSGMTPHPHDQSKVCTPFGFKSLADVQVGDQVSNPDGSIARVLQIHEQGEQDIYRLTFIDGATCVAGAEHKWLAHLSGKRLKATRRMYVDGQWTDGGPDKIMTTAQMATALAEAYDRVKVGKRPHWPLIPLSAPIEFTVTSRNTRTSRPVDPYLLGVLLGDGSVSRTGVNSNVVLYSNVDDEMADYIMEDNLAAYIDKRDGKSWAVKLDGIGAALHALGVAGKHSWEKEIPRTYKLAPLSVRWAIVRGMMDTDGYVDKRGHCSYTSTSEKMIDDLQWVVRSLGFKATKSNELTKSYTYKGEKKTGRPCWTLNVIGANTRELFRLQRKRERCLDGINGGEEARRRLVKVEKIGRATCRCITVDHPNGLYITDDFIVTHNSDALLMSALQFVDVPGYSALLLRKTWPDLNEPGAIMDRARTWLSDTDAQSREGGRKWVFPSGARLSFGYIQHDKDKFKLQSAEYQFIGWDELTHWQEITYTYLFSRLRRPKVVCETCDGGIIKERNQWVHSKKDSQCPMLFPNRQALKQYPPAPDGMSIFDIPLRMRAASNPGGVGHQWVRDRFIDPKTRRDHALFIPSRLADNPSLDQDSYIKNLMHLSPVDRERLLHGDWDVEMEGEVFQRQWFNTVTAVPIKDIRWCRYWDMAATQDGGDYTVGCKLGLTKEGRWVIADIVRGQWSPRGIEKIVAQVAAIDGVDIPIRIEQEGGSSGKHIIDHYRRTVLVGYNIDGMRPTGDKVVRANPVASAAEAGNVDIVVGRWNVAFLDEVSVFPGGANDDQVDALSGAFGYLAFARRKRLLV
jgi:predicted phage terminase large subunit-like protein